MAQIEVCPRIIQVSIGACTEERKRCGGWKGGGTISMGWQRHTVRGFVAGALKKAEYAVESFKPEGGERSYQINK